MKSSPNSALLSAYEETQIIARPAIQVESLGHHYGSRVALDDISLEVRQAEIFGLPNLERWQRQDNALPHPDNAYGSEQWAHTNCRLRSRDSAQ